MIRAMMLCMVLVWGLVGCGGGGGGKGAKPPQGVPFTGDIRGQLVAPNGETPIAGATVYIDSPGASVRALPRSTDNGDCPAPQGQSEWTCSGDTGDFRFAVTDLPPGSTLHAVKGAWELTFPLRFTTQSTGDLGAVAFGTDVSAGAARIAVVTGAYDNIEYLLAKMGLGEVENYDLLARAAHHGHTHDAHDAGLQAVARSLPLKLGTEKFDLYDGDGSLPPPYPEAGALFDTVNGRARLFDYDIVYINCGADLPQGSAWRATLSDYVAQGGALYVTDQSSEWLAGFSSYLGAARDSGTGAEALVGQVVDVPLANWLGNVTCTGGLCINGQTVQLEGLLFGWHLATPVAGAVTPLVRADVSSYGYPGETNAIMTLSFRHGQGQVVYSSYHVTDDAPESGYLPQERILEYMFFSQTP